jgi:hypothetical protein
MTKFYVLLGVYLFCTDGVQARDIEVREKEKKKNKVHQLQCGNLQDNNWTSVGLQRENVFPSI